MAVVAAAASGTAPSRLSAALPRNAFATQLHADAIEFSPEAGLQDVFVCGTYQLQAGDEGLKAEKQTRLGRLWLLKVRRGEEKGCGRAAAGAGEAGRQAAGCASWEENPWVEEVSHLDTPGIFDIKWSAPRGGGALLGHAAADGCLYTYSMPREAGALRFEMRGVVPCAESVGSLALSLDWNDRGCSGGPLQVGVSMSDGRVCVVDAGAESGLKISSSWDAHELEAWIVGWDCHNPHVLYSGADDGILKGWDTRMSNRLPLFQERKSYSAGVTCLQSHRLVEHCLVTGSYDEHVRVYDTRQMRRPLAEANTGGGVWRVKWHHTNTRLLAVARMHNHFGVLSYDHATGSFEPDLACDITGAHTSLGYGIDWQYPHAGADTGDAVQRGSVLATASFYDSLVQVWNYPLQ